MSLEAKDSLEVLFHIVIVRIRYQYPTYDKSKLLFIASFYCII